MSGLELALVAWLAYPVITSMFKGLTYASLSFSRGEVDEGLQILMRIPQAVLHMAVWPYTSTVGAVLGAIAFDRFLQSAKEGADRGKFDSQD